MDAVIATKTTIAANPWLLLVSGARHLEWLPKENDNNEKKLRRNVPKVSSALFFNYNTSLGPPYRVLVDTNFINFSIQNKLDLEKGMMDCLYAKYKMKELLAELSNQLQSSDTSGSIAWPSDGVFAKVMGKERKGRIRGIGFGPSPSGQSSKSALTDLQIQSSQARDNEVAQLKASLADMQEKLSSFDKMKEKLSQFEEMKQRMARMLQ